MMQRVFGNYHVVRVIKLIELSYIKYFEVQYVIQAGSLGLDSRLLDAGLGKVEAVYAGEPACLCPSPLAVSGSAGRRETSKVSRLAKVLRNEILDSVVIG